MAVQTLIEVQGMRLVAPESPERARKVAARYRQSGDEWEAGSAEQKHCYAVADELDEMADDMESDEQQPCSNCGSTETTEISTEGPPEQSITICAGCGAD